MAYSTYTTASGFNGIVRHADNAHIPTDPANTDYQAYLAWVAEGNTAEEWNPDGE